MRKSPLKLTQKVCKKCGNTTFLWANGMCKNCHQAKKQPTAKKQSVKQEAIARLDKELRAAIIGNKIEAECYTCGNKVPIPQIQVGHFVSRSVLNLRWYTDNVRLQCFDCNIGLHGNLVVFEKKLRMEIGDEAVDRMLSIAKAPPRITTDFIMSITIQPL